MSDKPKVHLSYEVEVASGKQAVVLPFVVGVLADLTPSANGGRTLSERSFVDLTLDNFDSVIQSIAPHAVARQIDFGRLSGGSIQKLDERIPRQLDAVPQPPDFQKVSAFWRGLHSLLESASSPSVKVRLLDVSKAMLLEDFRKADTDHKPAIFRKLHDEVYGLFAGEPYTVLIGLYDFGPSADDMELLGEIALLAKTLQTPFIASASPAICDPDSPGSASWSRFTERDEARYVGLVLPEGAHFGNSNAVLEFASSLSERFARYGCCSPIAAPRQRGLLQPSALAPGAADEDSGGSTTEAIEHLIDGGRFSHYLRAMVRDRIGVRPTRQSMELFLNDWISSYVLDGDPDDAATRAKYPLRRARIEVSEQSEQGRTLHSAAVFLTVRGQAGGSTSEFTWVSFQKASGESR